MSDGPRDIPTPSWWILGVLAVAVEVVHCAAISRYGYFRDELYYLASTDHLDVGYVEHPPLSIAVLAALRAVFGDSLPALRAAPVLCGAVMVILVGLLARELGGGGFAQALAALCVVVAPEYLGVQHLYTMNAFDQLLWAAATLLLARILRTGESRLWPFLGVVLGLGLLNKISVLWLGCGILVGLLATPHRRWLAKAWPWVAGVIAAALFVPYVAWQAEHGWPLLEFMRNATGQKMVRVTPLAFIHGQLLGMNPLTAPVWLCGLVFCLVSKQVRPWRIFAFVFLVVFAILALSGTSRASYLAPAYPLLFAPGALFIERTTASGWRRWAIRPPACALLLLSGAALAPFAIPILPPDGFIRYSKTLGVAPPAEEHHAPVDLPQHFADMFGWDEMAGEVALAYHALPPEDQARACIFAQNYGEAGAIDVLGRRFGLPHAISGHNTYWIWGPGSCTGEVVIVLGGRREDGARVFERFDQVGAVECARCMAYERDLPIFVGRKLKVPLKDLWPALKNFI